MADGCARAPTKTAETVIARIEEHELKIIRVNEQIEMKQFVTGWMPRGEPMPHIASNDWQSTGPICLDDPD